MFFTGASTCMTYKHDKTCGIDTFSPTAKANGVFSPDKLRCVPVRVAGAVPEEGSGRFRKVPAYAGLGRQVAEGSGEFRCKIMV